MLCPYSTWLIRYIVLQIMYHVLIARYFFHSGKVEYESCIELNVLMMPEDYIARYQLTIMYLNKGINLEQVYISSV